MISTPKPPDPYEQASAQAGANIDSAVANDLLNNRTEITPTGRIDYIDQGVQTIVDSQGKTREIPIRDRVITLSDGQQEILDLTEDTSQNLLGIAKDRSAFLGDYLQDGINTDDLTAWQNAPDAPQLNTQPLNFGSMESYGGPSQNVTFDYAGADTELGRVNQPDDLVNSVSLNTNFKVPNFGGGINFDVGSIEDGNHLITTASGDIAGAGEGIQDSITLDRSGGQIGELPKTFRGDRVTGAIDDAGQIQSDVNYRGPGLRYDTSMQQFTGDIADAGDIQRSVGVDDYSEDRRRVEDALMSRHNRHFEDVEAGLDAKLRAQGLVPGSEAYDTQFRQMREMQNDAIMESIIRGGEEQSRLFGLDLASGQFANQAQQQQFGQNQARGLFAMDVNRLNNATALAGDQFYNQAVGQGFQQAMDEGTFANTAQGQQFGQNVAQAQMDMAAANQNNALEEARARFGADMQGQTFQQTLANAGFGRDSALAEAQYGLDANQQRFSQLAEQQAQRIAAANANTSAANAINQYALGQGALSIDAQLAATDAAVKQGQLALAAQEAENRAVLNEANFANNAALQGLNMDLLSTGFNNDAIQGEIDNAADAAAFQNAAVGQDFAQGLGLLGFNNAATQQDNENQATAQAALNQYLSQQFALDQARTSQDNALRQSQLQEEFALRGQPINEVTSLMSGSQLMMPQFTAPFQTGTPPVPIGQYIQDEYEARLANSAATAQGLLGFGGALLGPLFGSDRRIKKNIKPVGKLKSGVNVYSYQYRHNDKPAIGVMADEVGFIPGAVVTLGGIAHVDYSKVLAHAG